MPTTPREDEKPKPTAPPRPAHPIVEPDDDRPDRGEPRPDQLPAEPPAKPAIKPEHEPRR